MVSTYALSGLTGKESNTRGTIRSESIKYIDEIFEYDTEAQLYDILKKNKHGFDVRIIGSDWKGKQYTGYDPIGVDQIYRRDLRIRHGSAAVRHIEKEQAWFRRTHYRV